VTAAAVALWGRVIGAVQIEPESTAATFQYDRDFANSGIEVAPLTMPLRLEGYRFPALPEETFTRLPGMLADSLPDRFGNAVIAAWLSLGGRSPESLNPVERLCYVGRRGMGALEFRPIMGPRAVRSQPIHIDSLVELASSILSQRSSLNFSFDDGDLSRSVAEILLVGTSAGGARAKAVIAYNPATKHVKSGQVDVDPGYEHWILKFDGVSGNDDRHLRIPRGYGAIEFAYSEMAKAAGIVMTECRLLDEGPRRHFMTRRFDRTPDGDKVHMQSLGAMIHADYNQPGASSYERLIGVCRELNLDISAREDVFRRMVFNVLAVNRDDHVKNFAFLMNRVGSWTLAPAFDVSYAYNPESPWTRAHQMTVNGKRSGITVDDIKTVARAADLARGRMQEIFQQVADTVCGWPQFASSAGVGLDLADQIQAVQDSVKRQVTAGTGSAQ
jgi:serine/threonine-protein kinase HipA